MKIQNIVPLHETRAFRLALAIVMTTALLVVGSTIPSAHAQTLNVVYNFGGNPGEPQNPSEGVLAQGRDGNIYGTSLYGGTHPCWNLDTCGTAFKITPAGTLTVLFDFDRTHGAYPHGLTLATDGNFYGAASQGGIYKCGYYGEYYCGTIFRITSDGSLLVLHNLKDDAQAGEGSLPATPPIQAADGNLYGTTTSAWYGVGAAYKITPAGTFTQLHVFGGSGDGRSPQAPLIQAIDGKFYGTTHAGGSHAAGTVFGMTPAGQIAIVHDFDGIGEYAIAPVIQGRDGDLYGAAEQVVFKLKLGGVFSVVHDFHRGVNGWPTGGLVQATDGNFYGLTSLAIYRITPGGFSWLYKFDADGGLLPSGELLQHTNGLLYGVTAGGGTYSAGTLFSLDIGAVPFARLVSTSGQIGKNIGILGQGFTGTSNVAFNGLPATFKVISDTYLESVVPNGAVTGSVSVTTPTITLTSSTPFRVVPKILSFNPTSGAAGTSVVITGTGLTKTLRVGFGGVAATSFTIDSDTQVTVIVPDGAVTGNVAIATQGGHDRGAKVFTVTP